MSNQIVKVEPIVINVPDAAQVQRKMDSLVKRSKALKLRSEAEYVLAGEYVKQFDALLEGEDIAAFENHVKLTRAANQSALALLKKYKGPLEAGKKMMLALRVEFAEARERAARLQTEKDNVAARNKQIADAKKVAAQVAKTDKGAAREIVKQAESTPVSVAPPPPLPKSEGFVTTTIPQWEVVDPALVPDAYWEINSVKIGSVVKACGLETNIPGIRVWLKKSEHTR